MSEMSMDAKFWLYENGEGNTLNVIFSARAIAPGRFSMFNSAKKLSGARLYFNCADNTWYQNDITGITEIIKAHRERRELRIFGISMGGYAATLWGCIFPFARSIAFSPNMITRVPFTHSWYYNFDSVPAYANLMTAMKRRKPKDAAIFFGTRDLIDMYFYGLAVRQGIEGVHALRSSHSTAAYLDGVHLLIPYLEGAIGIPDLEKHIMHPDPDVAIDRFHRFCAAMRSISALDRGDARRAGGDLDRKLFDRTHLNKMIYDMAFCGFIEPARGLLDHGIDAQIFDAPLAGRLDDALNRSAVRWAQSGRAPVLPPLADELDARSRG